MELNTIIYLSVSVVLVIATSFLLMSYFISRSRNKTDIQDYSDSEDTHEHHDLLKGRTFINTDVGKKPEPGKKEDATASKIMVSETEQKKTSFNTERMTRISSLTKRK